MEEFNALSAHGKAANNFLSLFVGGKAMEIMGKSEKAQALRESVSYNKLYIKILAGVFAVLTVCSGISALFMAGGGSGQGAVFLTGRGSGSFISKNEYGSYLIDSDRLIPISYSREFSPVQCKSGNNTNVLNFKSGNNSSVVFDGNYYYSNGYKYQMTGSDTCKKTEWVSDAVLEKAFTGISDFNKNAVGFEEFGDYIYFLFTQENNRLAYVRKDGEKAGYIGKIYTSSYVIINGDLYFFDDGMITKKEAGIYKADAEGSDVTLVYGGLKPNSDDTRKVNEAKLCDKLSFYKGFIYFIDYSAKGDGHVCRMRPDGSEYKQISPDRACAYTLDEETLYYYTGSFSKVYGKLYSHEIGSETQKLLMTEKDSTYLSILPIWHKGYIYLKSTDASRQVKRYSPKKDICEIIKKADNKQKAAYMWAESK